LVIRSGRGRKERVDVHPAPPSPVGKLQGRFRGRSLGPSLAHRLNPAPLSASIPPFQGVAPGLIGSKRSPAFLSGEFT